MGLTVWGGDRQETVKAVGGNLPEGTQARGNRAGRRGSGSDCRRENLANKVPLALRSEKMKEGTM